MRKIDYRRGHFVYDGRSSKDFGICIEETPSLDRPERKYNVYKVPGRNGDIVEMTDAWENIDKTYEVWAANDNFREVAQDFNAISEWLFKSKNYARLEDDFEPEIYRLGYFVGPLDVDNLLNLYGKTKITFNCRPERFFKSGEHIIEVISGGYIENPSTFTAKPLIKVTGSGNCSISIGSHTMNINNLTDYIYIDCDNMDAYRQLAENRNRNISGQFPVIDAGQQLVITTGNVTKVEITPNWFTI